MQLLHMGRVSSHYQPRVSLPEAPDVSTGEDRIHMEAAIECPSETDIDPDD